MFYRFLDQISIYYISENTSVNFICNNWLTPRDPESLCQLLTPSSILKDLRLLKSYISLYMIKDVQIDKLYVTIVYCYTISLIYQGALPRVSLLQLKLA